MRRYFHWLGHKYQQSRHRGCGWWGTAYFPSVFYQQTPNTIQIKLPTQINPTGTGRTHSLLTSNKQQPNSGANKRGAGEGAS